MIVFYSLYSDGSYRHTNTYFQNWICNEDLAWWAVPGTLED